MEVGSHQQQSLAPPVRHKEDQGNRNKAMGKGREARVIGTERRGWQPLHPREGILFYHPASLGCIDPNLIARSAYALKKGEVKASIDLFP